MYRAGLSGRRARAYPHYHEAPRHRIRQDAVIPAAEENFKTLMPRLISLSHADPLFQKFIAFCSRAKIAFSYLPF